MGVPKKRHSKSKVGRRRMHLYLKEPNLVKCKKCGHFTLPHRVCPFCGYYQEKEVIDVLAKLEKEERKKREKEMKMKEKEEKKGKSLSWKELSKKHVK
jgi:large subunit ribosomal protein L32